MNRTATVILAAALTSPAMALAQTQAAPRLDASIPAAARAAASQTAPADRTLTLDQATAIALAHNLDIAVERVNASAIDLQIAGVQAAYLPAVTSLFGVLRETDAPVTLLTGGQRVATDTVTINGSLTQNVPHGGGTASLTWNNNRVGTTNSFFYNYNPSFNTTLNLQYTQPLLRGFKTDAVRQQLSVTRTNRAVSDIQLEATIANTLSEVRNAYWDLVFAVDSIAVASESVDLARQLVDENQKRVNAGTMTELDLVSARAQQAASQHQLVVAQGNRRTAELALKRLLAGGPDDALWQQTIDPVDRPAVSDQPIDVEGAVRRALASRTDLAAAKQQVAANQATYEYLQDQTRAQADLVASYSVAGVGGTQLVRADNNSFIAPVVSTIPGSYGGALSTLAANDYPTWGVAVNVSYPIGRTAARAEAARAKLQIDQVQTEIERIEVGIVTDVTTAAIAVRNNVDSVQSASAARDLAEQRLAAEQKKFAAGMSTDYQVVQAQKDLADARNAELQAEVAYRKSLVEFDRAQQSTLQSAGVTIVSPSGASAPAGSGRPAAAAPSGAVIR